MKVIRASSCAAAQRHCAWKAHSCSSSFCGVVPESRRRCTGYVQQKIKAVLPLMAWPPLCACAASSGCSGIVRVCINTGVTHAGPLHAGPLVT